MQTGQAVSALGNGIDGLFGSVRRGLSDGWSRVAGNDPALRAVGSFGDGVAQALGETVSGTVRLVGDTMQLADEGKREQAARVLQAVAADPGAVLTSARNQVERAWHEDPARLVGQVTGNLIPVGAALSAVTKTARVGSTANALTRATGLLRRAEQAAPPLPLRSADEYAALVAQQTAHGSVSLQGVARPAMSINGTDLAQGAGRFEKAEATGMFDTFVPTGVPLPPGSQVIQENIPRDLVVNANLLSSRGREGANDLLVKFVTEGKDSWSRALIPVSKLSAPTSIVDFDVKNGLRALEGQLGGSDAAAQVLRERGFYDSSLLQKREILSSFGVFEQ